MKPSSELLLLLAFSAELRAQVMSHMKTPKGFMTEYKLVVFLHSHHSFFDYFVMADLTLVGLYIFFKSTRKDIIPPYLVIEHHVSLHFLWKCLVFFLCKTHSHDTILLCLLARALLYGHRCLYWFWHVTLWLLGCSGRLLSGCLLNIKRNHCQVSMIFWSLWLRFLLQYNYKEHQTATEIVANPTINYNKLKSSSLCV